MSTHKCALRVASGWLVVVMTLRFYRLASRRVNATIPSGSTFSQGLDRMPRKTEAERLTELEKRKATLNNRIAAIRFKASKKERKVDTRRKIIAGALALEYFQNHPGSEFGKTMFKLLNEYVLEKDRGLFDFLPVAPSAVMNAK